MNKKPRTGIILLPILLGLVLGTGIWLGSRLAPAPQVTAYNKINSILDYIQQEYVDTVNRQELVDGSIEKLLEQLDPHSSYIPASDLQSANEPLEGNFEGIGIEFHIQDDTVMVVSAISGGPSESAGLIAGDRIVKVEGRRFTGSEINNEKVLKTLRGKGGTVVTVSVYRRGHNNLIDFKITRGKIPINSVDVSYMIDGQTGFIKISRFSSTTYDEFINAIEKLKAAGLQNLILDLRGNPGGFLDAATALSDEFLGGRKLIVYTAGKARPRTNYHTSVNGHFEEGKLIILIDEGSASASEIVSGAVQDWDRGTIVGRRSFGKGLVQEQSVLPDGSALRLTIARYYTPTGRSIQKPYNEGVQAYEEEILQRFRHGESLNRDSIHLNDSLRYVTPAGRIVYGGGGIMPDVFVPADTTYDTDYLDYLFAAGALSQFAYNYVDRERKSLAQYSGAGDFRKRFEADDKFMKEFTAFADKLGVSYVDSQFRRSEPLLRVQLKAYIARLLWQNEGLYPILHEKDATFRKALSLIHSAS